MSRSTRTKGMRKREAIARREAERELRTLRKELRANWREQLSAESAESEHQPNND